MRYKLRRLEGQRLIFWGKCRAPYRSRRGANHMSISHIIRCDTLDYLADHINIVRQYDLQQVEFYCGKWIQFSAEVYFYHSREKEDYSLREIRGVKIVDAPPMNLLFGNY